MKPGLLPWVHALTFLLASLGTCISAHARDEVTVRVQLIWGTNQKESPNKDHKPIEKKTADELKKVFQWQNYFVINGKTAKLKDQTVELKMSEQCQLEIKYLGDDRFEVLLMGKGKPVCKGVQKMPRGERVFLMGLNENESAWLVILKQTD